MSDTINAVGAERRRTQYDTARPRPRRPEPADPTPAWRRVLRRWPTILSTWLLVLAAALVAGLLWPPTYQATASMTVTPSAVNPLTGDAGFEEVEMQTEMATMASQRITLRAAALLQDVPLEEADPVLAEELLESLSTTAPDDTQVLRVTVDAQDPNLAAERANALADAYLADRGEDVQTTADDTLKRIDESIAGLERTDEDSSSLRQLREQRTALALIAPTPGRVISEATPPQAPSSAGLLLFIAGGLVGGLVLGALAGAVRERADRSVRRPDRLADATGSAVVVLRSEDDEDGALELLRRLSQDEDRAVPRPGSRIAVHSPLPGQSAVVVQALDAVVSSWGGTVEVVDVDTLAEPVGPLAAGWLDMDSATPSLYVATVPPRTGAAQLAALTDRVDGVVLAVEPRGRLRRFRERFERLSGRGAAVVPAYVVQRQARPAVAPAPAQEALPQHR
ncbi:hypothetical protein [Kocuria turfanensis]|uniref:Polysaccharide chain length determinant N-terminal domain-containing protein n=2 Tax=Kocuria turfanensis TaxID=388357 RepID=A0A512IGB8_9MICC|nr:hypothetical protein [Kocuria turfanensis]GEO96752.1 hypothetical protein KTU01_28750 [Kocuria turfanensis]